MRNVCYKQNRYKQKKIKDLNCEVQFCGTHAPRDTLRRGDVHTFMANLLRVHTAHNADHPCVCAQPSFVVPKSNCTRTFKTNTYIRSQGTD